MSAVCLALLGITSSRFIHDVSKGRISYFSKAEKYSIVCVYLIFLLFLYLLTDPEIDSVSWPLWAMLQWTQRADMSVRSWPPLWMHTPGWNCWVMWWVVLCLVFWGNSILFSAVAAPVAFPTTLHKALFPAHFGSSCLFPSSRVSVTRAVTSPGSDVCICVSVSVCVYMCVYICV